MTTTLTFNLNALRPILAHAVAATSQRPTFAHLSNPAYWKPGVDPTARGWVEPGDVDQTKLQASVWLVKGAGIGIVSAGDPHQASEDGSSGPLTAYAAGFDPGRDADCAPRAVALLGRDEFTEPVDAREVLRLMEAAPQARTLRIRVTAHKISIAVR